MDSARFRRIEELSHSALEREPGQRDSFLQQACGNDAELRREVKALLAKNVSTGVLVDRSAWAGNPRAMATPNGQTVCVLTKTISVPSYNMTVSFFGTASAGFSELRFIATSSGTTPSGTAQKQ